MSYLKTKTKLLRDRFLAISKRPRPRRYTETTKYRSETSLETFFGISQTSFLKPLLLILCINKLTNFKEEFGLIIHFHSDDTTWSKSLDSKS